MYLPDFGKNKLKQMQSGYERLPNPKKLQDRLSCWKIVKPDFQNTTTTRFFLKDLLG